MEKAQKSNGKIYAIIAAAAVAVVGIIVAVVLIINANRSKLIGKWLYEYGTWGYNFIDDDDGEYSVGEYSQKFTYKDNGDSVTIRYEGSDVDMTLNYRIEGDKLIVTDSFGSDTVYNRQ
ncbi:hypothetical protein IKT64_03445 [Candidatus Saccharibacteria bacterium]|nr:hypothetical protein [Candidatus Saccharibacteria bacterium]